MIVTFSQFSWFQLSLYLLTIFFVIFLLFSVNTIYSLMSLAGIIFCTFLLLLIAKNEFFALIYLLIYIGAIIVFFLFSIMLLHLKFERIFEFEISHATATLFFVWLNFMLWNLLVELRVTAIIATERALRFTNFDDSGCDGGRCIPTVRNSLRQVFDESRFIEAFTPKLEQIGIILFNHHGFLCFVVGFILLITMFGSMQLLQYAKQVQKLAQAEGVEDNIVL